MSDYLSGLVEKSFGQTAVVKPRHTPLFAPSPYVAGALAYGTGAATVGDGLLGPPRPAEHAPGEQPIFTLRSSREPGDHDAQLLLSADLTMTDAADAAALAPFAYQAESMAHRTPYWWSADLKDPPASAQAQSSPARNRRQSNSMGSERTAPQPGRIIPPDHAAFPAQRQLTAQHGSAPASDNAQAGAPDGPAHARDASLQHAATPNPWPKTTPLQPMPAQSPPSDRADWAARSVDAAEEARAAGRVQDFTAGPSSRRKDDRSTRQVESPSAEDVSRLQHSHRAVSPMGTIVPPPSVATTQIVVSPASTSTQVEATDRRGELRPSQPAPDRQVLPDEGAADRARLVIRPVLRSAPRWTDEDQPGAAARTPADAGVRGAAAPAQPTIHVTIGRIEVRATPPPAPVVHRRPTSQAMSLDDYLKQRKGGQL